MTKLNSVQDLVNVRTASVQMARAVRQNLVIRLAKMNVRQFVLKSVLNNVIRLKIARGHASLTVSRVKRIATDSRQINAARAHVNDYCDKALFFIIIPWGVSVIWCTFFVF